MRASLIPTGAIVLSAFLLSEAASGSPMPFSFLGENRPYLCIGHRGLPREFPENTVASLVGALEAGADGVEFDVQMTSDNVVVLMHDDSVERTTDGKGQVWDLPYEDGVDRLRTRGEMQKPVPRFDEVLELLKTYPRALMYIDIKPSNPRSILQRLHEVIELAGVNKRNLIFGVWRQDFVDEIRERYGNLYTISHNSISTRSSANTALSYWNNVDNFSLKIDALGESGSEFVDIVRSDRRQRSIFSWTVNTMEQFELANILGLEAVITDLTRVCVESKQLAMLV